MSPPFVLTLVAYDHTALEPAGAALESLRGLGASVHRVVWLAESVACDLPFAGAEPDEAEAVVRTVLRGLPIDLP